MNIISSITVLLLAALPAAAADMEWGKVSDNNKGFVLSESGKTPEELRPAKTIPEAITLSWLELFQEKTPQILGKQENAASFLNNGVTAHRGNSRRSTRSST